MIDQLVRIYEERKDSTCFPKLQGQNAINYFRYTYTQGVIETVTLKGELIGYVEGWRITPEQFGRLILHAPFNIYDEDLASGPIAYVSDTFIYPQYRRGFAVQELKKKYWTANGHCEYFCGQALRKHIGKSYIPIKTFKRQEAYLKWADKKRRVTSNGRL